MEMDIRDLVDLLAGHADEIEGATVGRGVTSFSVALQDGSEFQISVVQRRWPREEE